ncbi:MAG TPA: flagellar hook-associated protein 3, partial [Burkholderiaceae bacterium]|nr:flagellar hook-associated protein 3 [Burkholderiaceae bacterium]
MRISTASAFDTGIATLQQRQGDLNAAQQQLTSGKRISRLSDDPVAAARAERARAAQARADADQRSIDASRAIVAQIESAFGDASDLVQQARELLVA